jgi:hypothetical protein
MGPNGLFTTASGFLCGEMPRNALKKRGLTKSEAGFNPDEKRSATVLIRLTLRMNL